jgi:hypothetical protein
MLLHAKLCHGTLVNTEESSLNPMLLRLLNFISYSNGNFYF